MIDIKKLTERDISREVIFNKDGEFEDEGILLGWDEEDNSLMVNWNGVSECRTISGYTLVEFKGPFLLEIVTRADLMDFDDD